MPLQKKYDSTPLQVLTDKATRERIRRLHRVTGRSQAQVMRDILAVGIPMMEDVWGIKDEEDEGDPLDDGLPLDEHIRNGF